MDNTFSFQLHFHIIRFSISSEVGIILTQIFDCGKTVGKNKQWFMLFWLIRLGFSTVFKYIHKHVIGFQAVDVIIKQLYRKKTGQVHLLHAGVCVSLIISRLLWEDGITITAASGSLRTFNCTSCRANTSCSTTAEREGCVLDVYEGALWESRHTHNHHVKLNLIKVFISTVTHLNPHFKTQYKLHLWAWNNQK